MEENKKRMTVYQLVTCALMAAVLCVVAPLSLQIGPVPISLATFILYLTAMLLGMKMGTVSCLIYLLLGLVGMPVFTGYMGGVGKIIGPTGGYLVGYLPMTLIAGFFVDRFHGKIILSAAGMILGTAVLYALGTAWFVIQAGCTLSYALAVCVVPFLLIDLAKIVLAVLLGTLVRSRLKKASLLA